ncbi:hypothetical protein [Pseudoalteromonas sp.]|uniref:hypothetical protein n=1 Tax=Pseudoalteromonas sp. TaxID=53249 RepID=UPI0035672AE6
MNKLLIKYSKCALGIATGIALGQIILTPTEPFDVYRPIVVGLLTVVIVFAMDSKKAIRD